MIADHMGFYHVTGMTCFFSAFRENQAAFITFITFYRLFINVSAVHLKINICL